MKTMIRSERYPQWTAHSDEIHRLLGVKRLPDEGMSERLIQGIRVYVKPIVRVKGQKSSKHRVMAICKCNQHLSVGRLHQHKCFHDQEPTGSADKRWWNEEMHGERDEMMTNTEMMDATAVCIDCKQPKPCVCDLPRGRSQEGFVAGMRETDTATLRRWAAPDSKMSENRRTVAAQILREREEKQNG